jgi:TRAP transporter TAXI family solute receptor
MNFQSWIHRFFFISIVVMITLCFVGESIAAGPGPKEVTAILKAGGGAIGGVGFVVMTGMTKIVKDMYPRIDITVVPGGWVGNLPRTEKREMDIGSTAISVANLAHSVKDPFDKPFQNIRSLYATQDILYYAAFVRKDFPADSLEEMFKKKIPARLCTLYVGNVTELMWRNLFLFHDTTWEDVGKKWGGKMNFVPWPDAVNLVKDGHADGILSVGTQRIGWAVDLTTSRPIKILKFSEAEMDYMKKMFGFGRAVIPGGTYSGIAEDVLCPTDSGMAVVNKDVPDDVVEAILTALWEKAGDYAQYHVALRNFKPQGMCKGMPLPFHKAAEKFYKEKGCLK